MVTTRNGKVIKYKAEDYGRYYNVFGRKPNKRRKAVTRNQISKLPLPPSWQVPSSPIKEERNVSRLRSRKDVLPTCCDYGPDRRQKFPEYFFCSECDFWEQSNDPINIRKKMYIQNI